MFETIEDLVKNEFIEKEFGYELKKGLNEAKQYLRTDFRVHLKLHSRIQDHCFVYALSDSKVENFQRKCDKTGEPHEHNMQCSRCQQVRNALGDVRMTIVGLLEEHKNTPHEENFKEMQETIHQAENKIFAMKQHILRSEYSNLQRRNIIEAIGPGNALITMDWGMKWIPKKYRETTLDWFGKRGLSYHISHVLAIPSDYATNELLQHTFVHVFDNEKQVYCLKK